jgi:hypothetical protein
MTSVSRISHVLIAFHVGCDVNLLAASSAEQDDAKHGVTAATIASLFVPHWQAVSVTLQPLEPTALVKHVICEQANVSYRWSCRTDPAILRSDVAVVFP